VVPEGAQSALVLYPRSLMQNWKEIKPSVLFLCDNIEKTFSKLKSRGVKFTQEPERMPWGTYAKFVDIDGNEFIIKK